MNGNRPEAIILHHSGGTILDARFDTSRQDISAIDAWHKQLGFVKSELGFHIGYHFTISWDGKITQTRNLWEAGFHVVGMNDKSIGILLQGNFDRLPMLPNSRPSDEQIKSLTELLTQLRQRYFGIPIRNHRFYASYKNCPGINIRDDWGENLVRETKIAALEIQRIDIMSRIIETLKILILRLQNKLGGQKYA